MLFLKQSTAVTVKIGPFLDSTDGNTQETALTIAQADVVLSKNGGTMAAKNDATSCTHDAKGVYGCPLNATDTGTLGRLQLFVHVTGALAVWQEYMVVTANAYDTFCSTDKFDVNVAEMSDIDFSATQKASINTEVDNALNTAVPASPTSDSINERVKTMDDAYTATRAGYLDNINQAGLLQLTATRAGYLDNLNSGVPLSATAVDNIWDDVVEGALTARHILRILLSANAGKLSGGGTTTLTFRDYADAKARITATVDASKNRTAITLDGT